MGAASVTITNKSGSTWPAGTPYRVELDAPGTEYSTGFMRTVDGALMVAILGAPIAAAVNSISVTQTPGAAGNLTITGALAAAGAATLDVARNVIITSAANDSTRTFTVTGLDEYGASMVEAITGANAGATAGKKAFKTVSKVSINGAAAGAVTVGMGDVLGLPFYLADSDFVLKEMEDGTVRTNGTFVAGDQTKATATTGDVRGTL